MFLMFSNALSQRTVSVAHILWASWALRDIDHIHYIASGTFRNLIFLYIYMGHKLVLPPYITVCTLACLAFTAKSCFFQ